MKRKQSMSCEGEAGGGKEGMHMTPVMVWGNICGVSVRVEGGDIGYETEAGDLGTQMPIFIFLPPFFSFPLPVFISRQQILHEQPHLYFLPFTSLPVRISR